MIADVRLLIGAAQATRRTMTALAFESSISHQQSAIL
jgi:hypothetical protein